MISAFYGVTPPGQAALLEQALALDAYCERGWTHAGLVDVARQNGMDGECVGDDTLSQLEDYVRRGSAVIVSATLHFPTGGRRGGRLVVFAGTSVGGGGGVNVHFVDPPVGGRPRRRTSRAVPCQLSRRAIAIWVTREL